MSPRKATLAGLFLGLASVVIFTTASTALPPLPEPGQTAELRLCAAVDPAGVVKCFEVCKARAADAIFVFNPATEKSGIFDCDQIAGPRPREIEL